MPSGDFAAQEAQPLSSVPLSAEQEAQAAAESALRANIKAKGQNAYYYAHAKRDTGEDPAPMPIHIPLESRPVEAGEPVELITSNYQFLDEGSKVKVYLPLEGVGAKCGAGCPEGAGVSASFQPRSLSVDVRGFRDNGRVVRFAVKELHSAVDPDACTTKVLANKVVITLLKADGSTTTWSKLTAK